MITGFLKKWYGDFTKKELEHYLFLGLIFSLLLGIYWTLRPLKDTIFASLVVGFGKSGVGRETFLAWAKVISMLILFPVVGIYGKMVDKFKDAKYKFLYLLASFYGVSMLAWAFFFASPWGLQDDVASYYRIGGWLWYVFVESFGSLVIALFWAFVVDISTSESAKKGFSLIVMIGQIGGILMPRYLPMLPEILGTTVYPLVALCGVLVFVVVGMLMKFVSTLPKAELKVTKKEKNEEEPGFLEGLKLMLSNGYLLGIFAVLSFFELITTIIDFNFKSLVFSQFTTAVEATKYLGWYGSSVNLVAFIFLALGMNNISRWLGIRTALALVPVCLGVSVWMFKLYPIVDVLAYLMIASKAINYALNGPALKQLYVPTSDAAKYKSQAWIETFGSRGAKAGASFINLNKGMFGAFYMSICVYFSLGLIAAWFLIAIYLGNTYVKAIKEKRIVC